MIALLVAATFYQSTPPVTSQVGRLPRLNTLPGGVNSTAYQDALAARIARDVEAGALPGATDAAALAGHVAAVVQGLAVLARDGAPLDRLLAVAGAALAGWTRGVEV